jgi:hypothetical protein
MKRQTLIYGSSFQLILGTSTFLSCTIGSLHDEVEHAMICPPAFGLHHLHCILCVQVKGPKNPIGQVETNEQRNVFTGGSDCSFSSTDSKRHVPTPLASKIQQNASVTERLTTDSPWSTTSASSSGQIAPFKNATRKGLERAGRENLPHSNMVEVLRSILRGWHSVSEGGKTRKHQARQEGAEVKRNFNEKGPLSGPRQSREADVSEREAGEQQGPLELGQRVQAGHWEDLQGWAAQVSFTQNAVLAHCYGCTTVYDVHLLRPEVAVA